MTQESVDILLVEDNPDDADLTIRTLRKHHLSNALRHVRDGEEALRFLLGPEAASPLPRLVILDLKLPKVDGFEVLRALRADPRTKTVPVVVMTSSREDKDLEKCYELGTNSYVVKPIEFGDFAEAVARLGLYWILTNSVPR
ncbi:MAG: response regulator [Planctomycetota bacterium]|nr:MAG: response regulator [Planctomycetota bacterium]